MRDLIAIASAGIGDSRENWLAAAVDRAGSVIVLKEGLTMFARNAHFRVKSLNMAAEFARTFENEVLPLLRAQEGFEAEITLANPGSLERITISLWKNKHNAEAYNATVYPQVLRILANVIDGTPQIRTFEDVILNADRGIVSG